MTHPLEVFWLSADILITRSPTSVWQDLYFKHEKVTDQVQSHLNDFHDIVDKDDKWKKYLYLLKNDVFF